MIESLQTCHKAADPTTSSAAPNGPARATCLSMITCVRRQSRVNINNRRKRRSPTARRDKLTNVLTRAEWKRPRPLQPDLKWTFDPSAVTRFVLTTAGKKKKLVEKNGGGISIVATLAFGLRSSGRIWSLLTSGLLRCNEITGEAAQRDTALPPCFIRNGSCLFSRVVESARRGSEASPAFIKRAALTTSASTRNYAHVLAG